MTENQGKPTIRFKGYTEAWEQRKLKDLCDLFTDGDWIEAKDQSDSGIRLIQTGNIGVTEFIDKNDNAKWISKETFDKLHCEKVFPGDILISRLPEPAGRACVVPTMGTEMITAVDCTIVRTAHDCSNIFLIQFLSTQGYFNDVNAALAGGTRQRISRRNLASFSVLTPSLNEQEATGTFLNYFDNLITLHQREYDKTINLKKAMLEKMFPKNGEDRPEIRFKGFTDAWEQRKFSELYVKTVKKNDFTYGKEDIISVANMYYKPDSYISDRNYLLTYNVFELGDIAFEGNKSKNYAHGRFVENTIGDGIVSHVFDTFKPIVPEHDLLYWKYAINNENIMGKVLVKSTKSSTMMTNLVSDDFLKESILVPSYKEQKQIGSILYQMENLITLHQRELKKLQNMKKAMLEKMFAQG